jgi:hypothetical protein
MTAHQMSLPPNMPARMKGLQRDDVGRPVPFFVGWVDGRPDFRTMDSKRLRAAIMEELCWVCGTRLSRRYGVKTGSFVAGPMCLINHTSAEPPCHADCAAWCTQACPFLINPNKVRRESNMPENSGHPAGIMIARNPGVTAVIESNRWGVWRPDENGILFDFDRIRTVDFYAEGRKATTKEIMESIETGLPILAGYATEEGPDALADLVRKLRKAIGWIPDWDVAINSGSYPLTESLL